MEALPSKEIMKRRGLFNRISKIYRPTDTNIQFSTVQEAKDYFWTNEAQNLFRYCCEEQYRVTEDKKGLQWTIAFGEPEDRSIEKWSDLWRDGKQELHDTDKWFSNPAVIEHNAPELF